MKRTSLQDRLLKFAADEHFTGKGSLSVALVITERAKSLKFPLDSSTFISEGSEGQVIGLGKGAVQKILKRHGLSKVLAHEGGRTSRGSMKNMRLYVAFLNEMEKDGILNLEEVESFWIGRVELFFSAKPFKLRIDQSRGLRMVIHDVVAQAIERQKTSSGTHYSGAVMQHLVGAKLDCVLGEGKLEHHSFSTSDLQTSRAGDFVIGDTAVHVTSFPSSGVVERCQANIDAGLRPVIITTIRGIPAVEGFADALGLANRFDVFEIEQFIALNVYEMGKFIAAGHRTALEEIIDRYNSIVGEFETDPSLRIERS